MPLRDTEAFVLRTWSLKESDKIVSLFTRDYGKVRAVARGARKFKSAFGASLEPFTRLHVIYFEREGRDLVNLDHCDRIGRPLRCMGDLDASWNLAWLAEITEQIAPEHDAQPLLYRLLAAVTDALEKGVPPSTASRYFEIWALRLQGMLPDLSACGACGRPLGNAPAVLGSGAQLLCESCLPPRVGEEAAPPALRAEDREFVQAALRRSIPEVAAAGFPPESLERCRRVFGDLLEHYVGKPLRSRRFLDELRRLPS